MAGWTAQFSIYQKQEEEEESRGSGMLWYLKYSLSIRQCAPTGLSTTATIDYQQWD